MKKSFFSFNPFFAKYYKDLAGQASINFFELEMCFNAKIDFKSFFLKSDVEVFHSLRKMNFYLVLNSLHTRFIQFSGSLIIWSIINFNYVFIPFWFFDLLNKRSVIRGPFKISLFKLNIFYFQEIM